MTAYQWTIAPLVVATAVRDKSHSLLHRDVGIKMEGAVLAWLLMNGNERILVDTGACGRRVTFNGGVRNERRNQGLIWHHDGG